LILAATLGLVLAAGTTSRAVASYRDDATYWSAALAACALGPRLLMKHGQFLGDAGHFSEAEAELRRALALGDKSLGRSTRTVVLDNLGDIALRQGRLDEARGWLDRALAVGPGYAPAHLHMARWHRARSLAAPADPSADARALAAEESRLAVLSIDKASRADEHRALLLRADLALDRGDKPAAIRAIEEALRYMPAGGSGADRDYSADPTEAEGRLRRGSVGRRRFRQFELGAVGLGVVGAPDPVDSAHPLDRVDREGLANPSMNHSMIVTSPRASSRRAGISPWPDCWARAAGETSWSMSAMKRPACPTRCAEPHVRSIGC
jgi:tetratricopeptide (TPR) repeat protein